MIRRCLSSPVTRLRVRLLSTAASDRLVGYSPMAQGAPVNNNNSSTYIPTEKDVTTSGGIWAPTSAKREALSELKTAAAGKSLEEQATSEQKLDLYLVDGLILIGKCTDLPAPQLPEAAQMNTVETWWMKEKVSEDTQLYQVQWKERLADFSKEIDELLPVVPSGRYLRDVRDYMDAQDAISSEGKKETPLAELAYPLMDVLEEDERELQKTTEANLEQAVTRFRLILAQEAASMLMERWEDLTQSTDQDVDRAAVHGVDLTKQDKVLSHLHMQSVLEAFILGDCANRVESLWKLLDRNRDGLLDEEKMNRVCELAIEPVGKALERLLDEALTASPARRHLEDSSTAPPAMGWRERRKDNSIKKNLMKMFRATTKGHFRDEVEVNHRMRCIYAWANKKHQDNKIESVHVEEQGLAGRKRYVELKPKISLEEFREVQRVHFKHLDRVAQEFLKSFREDILVKQGKGRQRSELYRESAVFLTAVTIIDYIITSL